MISISPIQDGKKIFRPRNSSRHKTSLTVLPEKNGKCEPVFYEFSKNLQKFFLQTSHWLAPHAVEHEFLLAEIQSGSSSVFGGLSTPMMTALYLNISTHILLAFFYFVSVAITSILALDITYAFYLLLCLHVSNDDGGV